MTAPDHPWLLPASLTGRRAAGRHRRSARDWLIDSIAFLGALMFWLYASWGATQPVSPLDIGLDGPDWLIPLDSALGLASCCALWLRRRWPVALAIIGLPVAVFSVTCAFAQGFILFTVVIHRPLSISGPLAAANVVAGTAFNVLRPDLDLGWLGAVLANVFIMSLLLAWGLFVRARRQLVLSLRDRAERAEAEQQLRVAQARQLERTRLARDMHDVLAHRISLLSLHAGALEFRPDAPPEDVSKAAAVIRSSAHEALRDLREVLGVLRDSDGTDDAAEPPQRRLADLPKLVGESRTAGMRVDLHNEVIGSEQAPATVATTAYRLVQEALTNARKHAPGAKVSIEMNGGPGDGLTLAVSNPPPAVRVADIPGTGTGLAGLAERVSLVGGHFRGGSTPTGDFRVQAWLPWPA
ncbi:histidine kinase [Luedemannella flava]|uniref:histidine kinase n=1 Tax=Luedemannella flava TaxID=349316 RepID=A0ABN2LH86_9ACTN